MNLSFLARVDDPELRDEIRRALLALQGLSEVAAADPGYSSHSSEEPIGPPGFVDRDLASCPGEGASLYEHYRWRFQRAVEKGVEVKRLWFLLWDAEQAHRSLAAPDSTPKVALKLDRADGQTLADHIVEFHEGQHSYRVSVRLTVSQGWVEKVRQDANRDPHWGKPMRVNWKLSSRADKERLIRDVAEGRTQQEVAQHLGLSIRTVATYWPKEAVA